MNDRGVAKARCTFPPRAGAAQAVLAFAALAGFAPAAAFAQAPPPGFYHTPLSYPGFVSYRTSTDVAFDGGAVVGYMGVGVGSVGWRWSPPSSPLYSAYPEVHGAVEIHAISNPRDASGARAVVGSMGPRGPIQRGDNTGYRYTMRAFRQVGDGPAEYLTPESTFWERSFALAVSADGDTVAGIRVRGANDNDEQGFVWKADGTFVTIPYAQPFDFRMDVNGMSADGTKVVGTSESAGFAPFRAFRWTQEEGTVQLPRPAGTSGLYESYGKAISGNGRFIAGDVWTPQYRGAVIWDGLSAPLILSRPEWSPNSQLYGIDNEGSIGFGILSGPDGLSGHYIWTSALGWEDPDDYFIRMGVQLPEGWNTDYVFDMSSDGTVFSIIGGSSVPGVSGIAVISVPSVATCTTLFLALPWCCPARRRPVEPRTNRKKVEELCVSPMSARSHRRVLP